MTTSNRCGQTSLDELMDVLQDADVVMFIFREEYYLDRLEPTRRPEETEDKFLERHSNWEDRSRDAHARAEIIVAKQRHGPTGKVSLRFHAEVTKFDNLEDASSDYDSDGAGEDIPF